MMRGYARVSTGEQNANLQIDAMLAAGVEREMITVETGSGALSLERRPHLVTLLQQVMPGDVLVVWRLDRLARNLGFLLSLLATLERGQVRILSLMDPIDTRSASGQFMAQIFGALAQFERAQLRERQMAGIAARRQRGGLFGRPAALRPAQVTAARSMAELGRSTREIARVLLCARSTVSAAVKGLPPYGPDLADVEHDPNQTDLFLPVPPRTDPKEFQRQVLAELKDHAARLGSSTTHGISVTTRSKP